MKRLLIIFHTHGVKTARMAQAVERGAYGALDEADARDAVSIRVLRCAHACAQDVLEADALVLGTPENFGAVSGMMKDFLERIFYPCEGRVAGRPWALFVGAGLDGSGAVNSVERIVTGLRLRRAHAPVVCLGELTPEIVTRCETLGATLAAGLALGAL